MVVSKVRGHAAAAADAIVPAGAAGRTARCRGAALPCGVAYREAAAPGAPPGLVECAWSAGAAAGGVGVVHQVLPDGCMDLVWTGTDLVVAGPDTAPHPARRAPGIRTSGLRFAPGRLSALLGVPAVELRDRRVPLAELHPRLGRLAVDRLSGAAGRVQPAGPVDAAPDTALHTALDTPTIRLLVGVTRALPGGPPDRAVAVLAARLGAAAPGGAGVAVAELADALGWTPRTLHRRCLAAFGYGPAVLRRVLRFRRATDLLRAGMRPAEVAARAGYADQPHLSRELRALGGVSPARLATR
jgi:AraC-like DNA-binding protein